MKRFVRSLLPILFTLMFSSFARANDDPCDPFFGMHVMQAVAPEAEQHYIRAVKYRAIYGSAAAGVGTPLILARQELEKAIVLQPDYVDALNDLADLLTSSDATRSLALRTKAYFSQKSWAESLYNQKRYKEAYLASPRDSVVATNALAKLGINPDLLLLGITPCQSIDPLIVKDLLLVYHASEESTKVPPEVTKHLFDYFADSSHPAIPGLRISVDSFINGYVDQLAATGDYTHAAQILDSEISKRTKGGTPCPGNVFGAMDGTLYGLLSERATIATQAEDRPSFDRVIHQFDACHWEWLGGGSPWNGEMKVGHYDMALAAFYQSLALDPSGFRHLSVFFVSNKILLGWFQQPDAPALSSHVLYPPPGNSWLVRHPIQDYAVLDNTHPGFHSQWPMLVGPGLSDQSLMDAHLLISLPRPLPGNRKPDRVVLLITQTLRWLLPRTLSLYSVQGLWDPSVSWLFRNSNTRWVQPGGDFNAEPIGRPFQRGEWHPGEMDVDPTFRSDITDFWNHTYELPSVGVGLKLTLASGAKEPTYFYQPGTPLGPVVLEYFSAVKGNPPVNAIEVDEDPIDDYLTGLEALQRGDYASTLAYWRAARGRFKDNAIRRIVRGHVIMLREFLQRRYNNALLTKNTSDDDDYAQPIPVNTPTVARSSEETQAIQALTMQPYHEMTPISSKANDPLHITTLDLQYKTGLYEGHSIIAEGHLRDFYQLPDGVLQGRWAFTLLNDSGGIANNLFSIDAHHPEIIRAIQEKVENGETIHARVKAVVRRKPNNDSWPLYADVSAVEFIPSNTPPAP